jgi:hypothetical protein
MEAKPPLLARDTSPLKISPAGVAWTWLAETPPIT